MGLKNGPKEIKQASLTPEELKDLWIADSGATNHLKHNLEGMFDLKDTDENVKVGNGAAMSQPKEGKVKLQFPDGPVVTMENVGYSPKLWINLFSLTKAMSNGWNIITKNGSIKVTKNGVNIVFDIKIVTKNGYVLGAKYRELCG